jgi:uncharacterized membrane protein
MKNSSKGMFWFFTIFLAFVNPVISFILLIMYYLPSLIKEGINESENSYDSEGTYQELKNRYHKDISKIFSKRYSDDTLNKFK